MSALLSLLTQWLLVFAEFNEKTSGLEEVDEFPGRISQETRGGERVAGPSHGHREANIKGY